MFELMDEAYKKGVVNAASAETKVKSSDHIRKLVRLVEVCTAAGVYGLLKPGD